MWYQLNIECKDEALVEELSDLLEAQGALSVTLTDKNDDPVLEPAPGTTPLWPEVIIQALFEQMEEAEKNKKQVARQYPFLSFNIELIPEKDWQKVWMDTFKPRQFGQSLWICPSWHTPPDPEAVNLFLDPGLAFGTGTHPTTALCLTWLEQASLNQKCLIDYGCGSGILALAAIKLGAKQVYAVDIDEQALLATQNNAQTNQISESKLRISKPQELHTSCEILIANILLAPLLDLRERFYQLTKENGCLVVSGILKEQAEELIRVYQPHFTFQERFIIDDWVLLVFKRS
ncbi:50S ribosomal protein L11 methyltransferase [Legionella israelensis]|uniref:Ribosomal protein L11 methyltransferase n=1 Tax=Legionella israelensis TaxID=454 RepID=A0AAX1EJS3_9GAMM|nr:50S ribosomal protein L11 methyltransferase [Legionella israelensis]QBR85279.1 50S ribosomal protein L11 methyltransferase [Legionella israelensis]